MNTSRELYRTALHSASGTPRIRLRAEASISGIKNGTLIGYKYFLFRGETKLSLRYRAKGSGILSVSVGDRQLKSAELRPSDNWAETEICFPV